MSDEADQFVIRQQLQMAQQSKEEAFRITENYAAQLVTQKAEAARLALSNSSLDAANRAMKASLTRHGFATVGEYVSPLFHFDARKPRLRWDYNIWITLAIFAGITSASVALGYALRWLLGWPL